MRRPDPALVPILLANALGGSRWAAHEAGEGGPSGLGSGGVLHPGGEAHEVDRGCGDEVLQACLGRADVARATQAHGAHPSREGALDAGAPAAVGAERRLRLARPGRHEGLVLVAWARREQPTGSAPRSRGLDGHALSVRLEKRMRITVRPRSCSSLQLRLVCPSGQVATRRSQSRAKSSRTKAPRVAPLPLVVPRSRADQGCAVIAEAGHELVGVEVAGTGGVTAGQEILLSQRRVDGSQGGAVPDGRWGRRDVGDEGRAPVVAGLREVDLVADPCGRRALLGP